MPQNQEAPESLDSRTPPTLGPVCTRIASHASTHSGDRSPDGARGDAQFGGALGLSPAGRQHLPQPPLCPAIQLRWPAGVLGELPELLASVPRGPCSPAHTGHLGDGYRLLAHAAMVEPKNYLVKP
jgi:hypothetical protein